MRSKNFIALTVLGCLLFPAAVHAVILFKGEIRNDAMGSAYKDFQFNDILETKLVLEGGNENKDFKCYADLRGYLMYGDRAASSGYYDVTLMRAFIRYFSPIGDITAGKTYINFGNTGLFNLFEFDKRITLNDLAYDKDGIMALEYVFYSGDYLMGKFYGGVYHVDIMGISGPHYCGGGSISGHAGSFDFGVVGNRLDTDRNLMGLFFKGDAVIGLQGAYAFHFDNRFKRYFNESNFGIDYSFIEGRLITSLMFYFNEQGAVTQGNYTFSKDYFFSARYYLYCNLTGVIDEFHTLMLDCFANAVDGSLLIMPSFKLIIVDGLSLTFLFPVTAGYGNQEFSYDRSGYFNFLIRIEGKF